MKNYIKIILGFVVTSIIIVVCNYSTVRNTNSLSNCNISSQACCGHELYASSDNTVDANSMAMMSSYLVDISTDPSVVAMDANFNIFAKLNTNSFDSVVIDKAPAGVGAILLDGVIFNKVTLYDDGTHGDEMAGDSIYTRSGFTYNWFNPSYPISAQILYRFTPMKYYTGASYVEEPSVDLVVVLAGYDTNQVSPSVIYGINDTLQYSEYTINVKRPAVWGDNPFPPTDWYKDSDLFHEFFCYENNFLLAQISTNNPPIGTGSGATFGPSSNFTQGIGKSIVDLGLPFVGLVTYHWIRYMEVYTVHEFLHKWCAIQDLYGSTPANEGITGFGHWAFVGMQDSGLKGPTSYEYENIVHVNEDTFQVYRNYQGAGQPLWSKLEQYMAGLIHIDSVPWPLVYIKNWEIVPPTLSYPTIVTGTLDTITKADWLSVVGPRVPMYGPTDYKVVQVVFSDELLNPGEMSYFDEGFRLAMLDTLPYFRSTFYQATDGLASISNSMFRRHYESFVQICPGGSYNGHTETGIYVDSLVASNGCDSIVILNLELITDDVFGDCCPDNLYADSNPLADGTYKANVEVHSDKEIGMNGNVIFAGGTKVNMNPGFTVGLGTSFDAIIDDCQIMMSGDTEGMEVDK